MHDKLEEISWVAEQPWVESQVITHATPTEVDNVDDDLARELAFYNQVSHTHRCACYSPHPCAAPFLLRFDLHVIPPSAVLSKERPYMLPRLSVQCAYIVQGHTLAPCLPQA